MAEGRVIKKYISTSEKVNNLPYEAMLIYTWCIPHSDDLGLIPASARKLRAIVGPMWDMTVEQFGIHLDSIRKTGLLQPVSIEDKDYYYVVGHMKEQVGIKKKDRKPSSMAIPLSNWDEWQTYGDRLESGWNPNGDTNVLNINEIKEREYKDLTSLNDGLCKEIAEELRVSLPAVRSKRDDLLLHCQKFSKSYDNYRAALVSFIKTDIKEGKITKLPLSTPMPVIEEQTPEQQAEVSKKISEFRNQKMKGMS